MFKENILVVFNNYTLLLYLIKYLDTLNTFNDGSNIYSLSVSVPVPVPAAGPSRMSRKVEGNVPPSWLAPAPVINVGGILSFSTFIKKIMNAAAARRQKDKTQNITKVF